ncbi:MAG: hypothetical protein V4561_06640 [Bacteroidota bacterium]
MKTNTKWIFLLLSLVLLASLSVAKAAGQGIQFGISTITLPDEIRNPDNEFSGLYISADKLFLLPENRLEHQEEGKLYVFNLSDLDRQIKDSSFRLPFSTVHIKHLNVVKQKIKAEGQAYEGLEAILVSEDTVYLSVESTTPSSYCYLLKGKLENSDLIIDTQSILPVQKPLRKDGSRIYNAGFESLEIKDKEIILFYEFNGFPDTNNALILDPSFTQKKLQTAPLLQSIPFRLTDITRTSDHHYTGINYFYKGGGPDTLYRPAKHELSLTKLVQDASGYHNYCRLIDIEYKENTLSWKTLWEFPPEYAAYNWEGIATSKNGYFIINDRYTPAKPYHTTLLYLSRGN